MGGSGRARRRRRAKAAASSSSSRARSSGRNVPVRGLRKRVRRFLASNKDLIVVIIALLGAFSGLVGTVRSFFPSRPSPPSEQAILDQAEGWARTYSANFSNGFKSNWSPVYTDQHPAQLYASDGNMQMNVEAGKSGAYAFFRDNETPATLPAGDFYLSASNLSDPKACEYGLLFNIDTDGRFGWLYILNDADTGQPYLEMSVSLGWRRETNKDLLTTVFYKKVGQVDSLGILRYGSQYIAAVNGNAVAEISAAQLSALAKGPFAGSQIGVGTFTCAHTQFTYNFRTISLQAPTEMTNSNGNIEAQASFVLPRG